MTRTVVLLLLAWFCANVSSDEDCILEAVKILRGKKSNKVKEPPSTVDKIDIRYGSGESDESLSDDLISFEQMYLGLKDHYDQKLRKLQIEYDLLEQLYSNSSNSKVHIHSFQTYCTCNVTDKPTTNDCNNLQSATYLENVQQINDKLSNINERMQVSSSNNGHSCARSDVESESQNGVDWRKLPGAAVEISANGKELWVINSSENIYRWAGSNWELKPGAAVRVGSSPDGWTWVVNKNDNIYRWNVDKNNWDLMPGKLVQISAMSKDIALGVARGNGIFMWSKNAWKQLPGGATWAGIGDGDERWVVSSVQEIFRWNHQANTWNQMPGAAVNVDVQNPCRVIVTNVMNQMYIWRNNNWQTINGVGTRSSINETHYFTVNNAQQLFIGN